ncbi:hypothetical protein PTQ33_06110 [Campylobacter sp. 50012-21]|uniref:hypothetical protein n=1 Tax=Campylobacter magnus TaxID=3026462 RepID=UPI00235EB3CB|nr:hypothetical protein [Campylobacter magnus]MDD0846699.1 hypothetical protein [Campylobacter magnus]
MIKCVRAKTRALPFKLRLTHHLRLNFALCAICTKSSFRTSLDAPSVRLRSLLMTFWHI